MAQQILFILIFTSSIFGEKLFSPLLEVGEYDKNRAELGKILFFDPSLSKDGTVSCSSCHDLSKGGADNSPVSKGVNGANGLLNSPTIFNSKFNFRQFWNGRAKNLYEQIIFPIINPVEMGSSPKAIQDFVQSNRFYRDRFNALYKDGVTFDNIVDAIVEFEKALVTPNSKFDRFLNGDLDALSKDEKEGYELFVSKGCAACHNGIGLGGNLYNKFGVLHDSISVEFGRYEVTGKEKDRYFFKVPSLRNVELTPPYFHDGRTYSLREAIKIMAKVQLGREFEESEVEKIELFLKSLNGEKPKILTGE